MRLQHGFIALFTLVVAALMTLGTFYTDQFSQAALAESGSFDALAHALFDDLFGTGQQPR